MADDSDDDQIQALAGVGRDLLSFELEAAAANLYYEFQKASKKARNADRITEADAQRLAHAIERADMFVDGLYDACPEADRPPAVEDLLSGEELQEITARNPVPDRDDADQ
ncbi:MULTISPECIES: hypothetical protein [unclassified Natrinema]|uniref:hypothetical protein n=1 Tax=unclassified Natrinema TaxID=2622230 RepID=UPI00026D4A1D|nr:MULTISPECIES: hypothetical protein [unclassified Natrinema]AFO59243.1 hypothetical protein NJ7G_4029 [Natrinema sp. J7-2]